MGKEKINGDSNGNSLPSLAGLIHSNIQPDSQDLVTVPSQFTQTIKFPRSRSYLRVFSTAAVLTDGTYSAFMFETAPQGLQIMLKQLGVELTPAVFNYVLYAAIPLVACNLITDITCVDMMREADDLALVFSKKRAERTAISALIVGFTIKALAMIGNYPIGASADAIPVADLISKYLNGPSADVLRYSSLILIGSLEILYYILFFNDRLQSHANALINTLKNFPAFCRYIFKHPGRYAEILIQVSANAANRGISFAFIMEDGLQKILRVNSQSKISRGLSIGVGVNSVGITFFTRFLSTYNKLLNKDFDLIKLEEYQKTNGLCKALIADSLFSAIRGGASGMLVYELANVIAPWDFVIAASVGSVFGLHSLYSHYTMRHGQNALELIDAKVLEARRTPPSTSQKPEQQSETMPLLASVEGASADPITTKALDFDAIAATKRSRKLDFGVSVVINATHLLRLMAFWLFVSSVNELLFDNKINPQALFALTLLWGAEVFQNNRELYRGALTANWTGIAARWELEKESAKDINYNQFKPSSSTLQNLWCRFTRLPAVQVATKSPYDYPEDILENTKKRLVIQATETPRPKNP